MSLKLTIRYKLDISALEDQTELNGKKTLSEKGPIGEMVEYVGSIEDIKRKICSEIDMLNSGIEDLYFEKEELNYNK